MEHSLCLERCTGRLTNVKEASMFLDHTSSKVKITTLLFVGWPLTNLVIFLQPFHSTVPAARAALDLSKCRFNTQLPYITCSLRQWQTTVQRAWLVQYFKPFWDARVPQTATVFHALVCLYLLIHWWRCM